MYNNYGIDKIRETCSDKYNLWLMYTPHSTAFCIGTHSTENSLWAVEAFDMNVIPVLLLANSLFTHSAEMEQHLLSFRVVCLAALWI